ncbi:hypothetical protein [Shewanella algae]|uniref:hypothetical protein n=1 Tax=Shewanella algae TaxID=38313 RepID=UPI000BB6588D|nr:hypothetical protein [Shewanella algae]PBQ27995.1 hypothetical protein AYI97_10070 [Shewanella algae]
METAINPFNAPLHYWRMRKVFKQLTPAEQEFIRTKKLDATHSTQHWLLFLKRLTRLDRMGSPLRRQFRRSRNWLIGFTIVSIFLPVPHLVVYTLVGLTLASILLLHSCNRMDVNDNVRTGLTKLMQVLAMETNSVQLKLDLDSIHKRKPARTEKPEKSTQLAYFEVPLLQFRAKLKDGNELQLRLDDVICRRKRTRRNARGKVKTKIKYKGRRSIRSCLTLNPDHYHLRKTKLAPTSKAQTQNGITKVKSNSTFKFIGESRLMDAENILRTIAKSYQQTSIRARG